VDAIRFVEPLTFDADSGKNGGGIVRTLTGDHNDRVTDMTALILEPITYDAQVTSPLHKDNIRGGCATH
jgi:hypothetical protein